MQPPHYGVQVRRDVILMHLLVPGVCMQVFLGGLVC